MSTTDPAAAAKRLASLEPQPIVLPSVEEVARAILGDDEMQGEAFSPWDRMPDANRGAYRSNAKAVLDLITSRASTWVPQQPQPIVLPSVEDASRRIREAWAEKIGNSTDIAAQAVLDLIASRVPVWVPIEPGTVVKAGTMYRVAYDAEITKAVERVAVSDFCASDGFCIDPRTVPVDDPLSPAVAAFKEAWHAADAEGRVGQRVHAGLTAAIPHIAALKDLS